MLASTTGTPTWCGSRISTPGTEVLLQRRRHQARLARQVRRRRVRRRRPRPHRRREEGHGEAVRRRRPRHRHRGIQSRRGIGGAFRQRDRGRRRDASTACSNGRRCASSACGTSSRPSAFPINLGFNFNRINLGYKLGLSKGVKFCYHALALDEAPPGIPADAREGRLRGVVPRRALRRRRRQRQPRAQRHHAALDAAQGHRQRPARWRPTASRTSCTRVNIDGKIGDNFDPIQQSCARTQGRRPLPLHRGRRGRST